MTAPAAPHIGVNSDGTILYVRFRPVDTATDYNIYVQEAGGSRGIEAQLDAVLDLQSDGWFFHAIGPFAGIVTVDVTALNVGAEESSPSNTVQRNLMGAGYTGPSSDALQHNKGNDRYGH